VGGGGVGGGGWVVGVGGGGCGGVGGGVVGGVFLGGGGVWGGVSWERKSHVNTSRIYKKKLSGKEGIPYHSTSSGSHLVEGVSDNTGFEKRGSPDESSKREKGLYRGSKVYKRCAKYDKPGKAERPTDAQSLGEERKWIGPTKRKEPYIWEKKKGETKSITEPLDGGSEPPERRRPRKRRTKRNSNTGQAVGGGYFWGAEKKGKIYPK